MRRGLASRSLGVLALLLTATWAQGQDFAPLRLHDGLLRGPGDTLWGTITREADSELVFRSLRNIETTLPRASIQEILRKDDPVAVFEKHFAASQADGAARSLALSRWAAGYGLFVQARRAATRAALAQDATEAAFQAWFDLVPKVPGISEAEILEDRLLCCDRAARAKKESLTLGLFRSRQLAGQGLYESAQPALDALFRRVAPSDSLSQATPGTPDSLFLAIGLLRGEVALKRRDLGLARRAFGEVAAAKPDSSLAHWGSAAAAFAAGDLSAADSALAACAKSGGHPLLAESKAALALARGRAADAWAGLQPKLATLSREGRYLAALAATQLGRAADADTLWARLGADPLGALGRGYRALLRSDTQAAERESALAADGLSGPLAAYAALQRSRAAARAGLETEALRFLGESLTQGCPDDWALEVLHASLPKASEARLALSLLAQTAASRDRSSALCREGRAWLELGKHDEARLSYEAAAAADSLSVDARAGLLYLSYQSGRPMEIDAALSKLVALDPQNAYAAQVRRQLDRVQRQVSFAEDFRREADSPRILNGWEEDEGYGLEISIQGGRGSIRGSARTGITRLFRPVDRKPAGMVLEIKSATANARVGLNMVLGSRSLWFYVENSRLWVRVDQSRPGTAEDLGPVPAGAQVLSVVLPEDKKADAQLWLGQNMIREVKISGFQTLKKAEVAVFAEAAEGAEVAIEVGRVEIYAYR